MTALAESWLATIHLILSARHHSKQINGFSYALEVTLAAFQKTDIRPGDQILHGPGHKALVRPGQRCDSRSDVHGNTSHIAVGKFDLGARHEFRCRATR